MKKISIAVVATIIVLIIITQISSIVITQNNENNGLGEALAYNNDPNNILDNVFTDMLDDQNVIPFVFTKTTNFITKESIMNQFNRSGLTVTDIKTANGDFVGTGSEIYVEGAEKPYIILIYGDVNGDGQVNLIDAQKIVLYYAYSFGKELTGIYKIAANCDNSNDEVDLIDAQRIVRFYAELSDKLLIQDPTPKQDTEKPVITLLGSEEMTIKIGTNYEEPGAIVTDNRDINLEVVIDQGALDTNKVGTYRITYNATDRNGNKADEVVRIVHVDYKEISELNLTTDGMSNTNYTKENNILRTISAGINEPELTDKNVKFDIRGQGNISVKIQTRGEVDKNAPENKAKDKVITYIAKTPGTYTITPYVGNSLKDATVKAKAITVKVVADPVPVKFVIGEISEKTIGVGIADTVYKPITFYNKNNEQIEVMASELNIEHNSSNIFIEKCEKSNLGNPIEIPESYESRANLSFIAFTGLMESNETVIISLKNVQESYVVKTEKLVPTKIEVSQNINIVKKDGEYSFIGGQTAKGTDESGKECDYLLIPVVVKDQNGSRMKINANIFAGFSPLRPENKILLPFMSSFTFKTQTFRENEEGKIVSTGANNMDYIGFALNSSTKQVTSGEMELTYNLTGNPISTNIVINVIEK